jgi:tetratricopeptide (TPR) repeat protein
MKTKMIITILIVIVFSFNTNAQNENKSNKDKKQSGYANVEAIKTYERVAEKGYKSIDIFRKLGDSHYFNGDMEKAAKWYGELFAMTTDLESVYYYRYSDALKYIGNNDKSNEMFEKFNVLSEIDNK